MNLPLILIAVTNLFSGGTAKADQHQSCPTVKKEIAFYRNMTWAWQDDRDIPRTRAAKPNFHSCKYAQWVADLWAKRAHQEANGVKKMLDKKEGALRRLQSVVAQGVVTPDWECIHRYEGDWSANTGNGYYGGLQMDYGFMQSYGAEFLRRWGTANNWPVYAQVIAANRAKVDNGYAPWPNTARMCGLL